MAEQKEQLEDEVQMNNMSQEMSRRIFLECDGSGMDYAMGKVVNVANAQDVFKQAEANDFTEEEQEAYDKRDWTKAIITGVTLKSVSSDCPQPVTIGLNLFENDPNIVNSAGWLYARQHNDMTQDHAHSNEGFTNLVTVLPFEKQRLHEVLYTPENVVNNRYIKQYGAYTLDKLWEGVVPFPNEPYYYVDQDHVVMKIIGQNWEQLGISPEHEQAREGHWIKVGKEVVSNCIKQLYENVISQIPYTNFKDLGARFQANTEGDDEYKVVCELLVKYKFP